MIVSNLTLMVDVDFNNLHIMHHDYAPYRFIPKELVILVKDVFMLQLTDAIKAL